MKQYDDLYEILDDGELSAWLIYYSDDKSIKVFNWQVKYGDIIIMSGSVVAKDGEIYWHSLGNGGLFRAVMVYNLMPDKKPEKLLNDVNYMGERIYERRVFLEGNVLQVQNAKTEIAGYDYDEE